MREKVRRNHPPPGPRINHHRAPSNRPHHSPRPSPKPTHPPPRHLPKPKLATRAHAHKQKEPAHGVELRPPPEPPHPKIMQQRRHRERAHERARPPQQQAPGQRAKHDKHVPEELVPAEAPELRDGRGFPGMVGERGPAPRGLPEEDAAHKRRGVVQRVDGRVHHQSPAGGVEDRPGAARDRAQGRIEDGVACGDVDGGPVVLHEVVGDVKDDQLEEHFR